MYRIALVIVSLTLVLFSGVTAQSDRRSDVRSTGRGAHWQIEALFTAAQFRSIDDVGYEFGPILRYTGGPMRIKWLRLAPLFPEPVTLRSRPGEPRPRDACIIDIDMVQPGGESVKPGQTYTFGTCDLYPWAGTADELRKVIANALFVVAWEDERGVHAEPVSLHTGTARHGPPPSPGCFGAWEG